MRVLLVTGNYLPGKNGGIENYSHWLATLLLQSHFEVEVAALNVNETEDYFYDGVKVNYLKGNFSVFESLLEKGNFDICHFHEYSEYGGIEIPWFKKAKEHTKKVFFTFHLPYFTCYKGDFRYKGVEDCDIFSDSKRCTECVIADKTGYQKSGKSEMYLSIVSGMMAMAGKKRELEKRIIEKYQKLNELISICDNIFIYADWFKNILSGNGYNDRVIKKIPYKTKTNIQEPDEKPDLSIKNKLLFVGRIQYQKGLHLLCKAMNDIASKDVQLDVYGNIIDQKYFENCLKKYSFNFKGTTGYHHLLSILNEYDFLVLPSVFTEMFSLIIKDAFYEKLPVIASSAKGNKDAIVDGINGFLFEYDNVDNLAATIDRAYRSKEEGWIPKFFEPVNPEKDIEEIVSYYL